MDANKKSQFKSMYEMIAALQAMLFSFENTIEPEEAEKLSKVDSKIDTLMEEMAQALVRL